MEYSLSGGLSWSNCVAVPKIVFEDHLRLSSARQLKALLFILGSDKKQVTSEEIASFLGCDAEDAVDIMEYWFANGIVEKGGESVEIKRTQKEPTVTKVSMQVPESAETAVKAKPVTKVLSAQSWTAKDIVARASGDETISMLLNAAQGVLGKTISTNEQGMIINMVDYYGLKPEIILVILEYARSVGKDNFRYISTVAKNWSDEGIETIEEAEKKLSDISSCDTKWKEYCRMAEIPYKTPTAKQSEKINRWTNQWGMSLELIGEAVERAKDAQPAKFTEYVDGILTKWYKFGIRTLDELHTKLDENNDKKRVSRVRTKDGITSEASYDIDEINDNSFLETLNFGGLK